ncbi:hypothetical protein GCM10010472_64700 [Pseudonocardia halophobica]|uniref:Uncharacterized protein n=1 Tax=Pseudonocardia halophobica TaxID=29401 RepID=A0A9W6UG01_9PSEU|nr:hypothetical protein [Pseudonocardia halophobica]GLL15863.1 hypothetical protein GCM10017577_70170 [Pseudonocardia halophobica]
MDYPTMRDLFFAAPPEPRPLPPAATSPSPARALRDAIEPLACLSIWSPEAAEAYAELGLDDYFAAYVWQRAAALGTPPAPLAVVALGVFTPELITPQYEAGRVALRREDVVRVRIEAPGRTLRRVLGDIDDDAARAVTLLRRGIDAADRTARPLFTGLTADHWPGDPLAGLVHACHLLREHRGDSHLAVCAVEGLDPVGMNLLTELWCGYAFRSYTVTRGWSDAQIDAAADRLRARGLLAGDRLTEAGLSYRAELERRTDRMQQSVVEAIGGELDTLTKQLCAWSDALVGAGAAPPDPAKRFAG